MAMHGGPNRSGCAQCAGSGVTPGTPMRTSSARNSFISAGLSSREGTRIGPAKASTNAGVHGAREKPH
jgi:hypothetical protein